MGRKYSRRPSPRQVLIDAHLIDAVSDHDAVANHDSVANS